MTIFENGDGRPVSCGRPRNNTKMMNRKFHILSALAVIAVLVSCEKVRTDKKDDELTKPGEEISKADQFAIDALSSYYLWNKEIQPYLAQLDPDTCRVPVSVVQKIRYHENGVEVDHWTRLTDDLESLTNSVKGEGLSFGYGLQAGKFSNLNGVYFLLVSYVAKDSPAEAAGLKRGDIILTLDGEEITSANINDALNASSIKLGMGELSGNQIANTDRTIEMTAVDMWENPIIANKVFDIDGKKVGYLFYNSFDIKSRQYLPEIFRDFKSAGISELILDLRYNGGGYLDTEAILASLIAPKANVEANDVFQTEVYNSELSKILRQQGEDTETRFSTLFDVRDDNGNSTLYNISGANPDLKKIYFIVTGGTASASEGLIVGIAPYTDITLIGSQTYGKYCAGILLAPNNFYKYPDDYSIIEKWGIYVMVSKFADKNGKNASIPDGISPDIEQEDMILDGYDLGDENETMLKTALQAAGKKYTRSDTVADRPAFNTTILEHGVPRGMLIRPSITPVK